MFDDLHQSIVVYQFELIELVLVVDLIERELHIVGRNSINETIVV